jgi:hypothetical protein
MLARRCALDMVLHAAKHFTSLFLFNLWNFPASATISLV